MKFSHIDGGEPFDWGKTSELYAKYRDIYPEEFLIRLIKAANIREGADVLDLGTGSGVIPRMLYATGARFTGVDISENQISEARRLANEATMCINFECLSAEEYLSAPRSFDSILACQCFDYFDHKVLAKRVWRALKSGGRFAVAYMSWLPFEDEIAGRSEALVLKYNPKWTGCGERPRPIRIPEIYLKYFSVRSSEVFRLDVPFTRESWHGRMLACRGVSASLGESEVQAFSDEHMRMLSSFPERFTIKHYAAIAVLEKLPVCG